MSKWGARKEATVPTLFWHVGIKFERLPSNRDNEILSKDLDRSVELLQPAIPVTAVVRKRNARHELFSV